MSSEWEGRLAWDALMVGAGTALVLVVLRLSGAAYYSLLGMWEAAFWALGLGASGFYGLGCFRVWPDARPYPGTVRSRAWFVHQYWLNGLGSLVGWAAARILWSRYCVSGSCGVGATDLVLGLVAFAGITGHLPYLVLVLNNGLRDLLKRGT